MFYLFFADVLDIQKEDILYSNEKVNFPIKYTALFTPPQQNKLRKKTADVLSKFGVKVGKKYDPKKRIELLSTLKHGRSAVLPVPIRFSDDSKSKNVYSWINFKGIGNWIQGGGFTKNTQKLGPRCDEIGHLGYSLAKRDQVLSDKLISLGFRTSVVLFIIKLREIPGTDGRLHPTKEFLDKYKLPERSMPVVMARGMRSYLRISDFLEADNNLKKKLLDAAILGVRDRDKDKSVKDRKTFLIWFAETIAKQLAILYSVRACHNWIRDHNITIAAEIVDLDSLVSRVLVDSDGEVTPNKMFNDVMSGYPVLFKFAVSTGLEENEVHEMLLQHYLFKYLCYVTETKFKSDSEKREDIKMNLVRVYDWVVNSERTSVTLKRVQRYDVTELLFISIDNGYDAVKKALVPYVHGY